MDAALGWLGKVFDAILTLFPHREIIRITHKGVIFKGKRILVKGPGVHWYCPLWSEIVTYPVVRQSNNLPSQNLTTKDLIPVTVSGVVFYKIHNIEQALARQWDLEDNIKDIALGVIADCITGNEFEYINKSRNTLNGLITEELQKELRIYGVTIIKAKLTDFAKTHVVSVVTDSTTQYVPSIKEISSEGL